MMARQKGARKRSLRGVNEHFEPLFNAASAALGINQNFLKRAIEDRSKSAQVGHEIAKFFFLKAICNRFKDVVLVAPFNAVYGEVVAVDCEHLSQV